MSVTESFTAGNSFPATDAEAFGKAINRSFFAGKLDDFFGLEADIPTGWLLAAGGTIGNGSSGASSRANADMAALFAILWAVGNADGTLAILTSAGAGSTYGANAAADFAANKRIALPDLRGRATVGIDDMGGSDAGRMVVNDAESEKVGGACGAEVHTLIEDEIPSHTHTIYQEGVGSPSTSRITAGNVGSGNTQSGPDESSVGGDDAHNNMQPSMFVNKIIATGVVW